MPWRKRTRGKGVPAATAGQREASKALDKAEESLERAQGAEREIMTSVRKLKRLGEDNDFAARIARALGGTP
jgi:hypothetical protein